MYQENAIQPAPLVCSKCDQEFDYIEDELEYTCRKCGRPINNLQAQFAYSRGYDAFFAAQQIFMEIPPNRRTHRAYFEQIEDVVQILTKAYTAIQEALQSDLADSQRYKSIEMMASIAVLFMQSNLISPLEATYWTTLMVEQVNRTELNNLNQKLAQPSSNILNFMARLNWRRRKHQLAKALAQVEKKIGLIEQNIAFITPPRVHKPTGVYMGK